jgi:hypothetical protein
VLADSGVIGQTTYRFELNCRSNVSAGVMRQDAVEWRMAIRAEQASTPSEPLFRFAETENG